MIGTFLVAVAALVVAILGCAWAKPVGVKDSHHHAQGFDGRDAGQRVTIPSGTRSIEHAVPCPDRVIAQRPCRNAAPLCDTEFLTGANRTPTT